MEEVEYYNSCWECVLFGGYFGFILLLLWNILSKCSLGEERVYLGYIYRLYYIIEKEVRVG